MIEDESPNFPVGVLCRVLRVSRSAFYAWRRGESHAETDEGKREAVEACFSSHLRRYGSRRVHAQLRREGWGLGRHALQP